MARQNHEANYIYDVDGETVWERLRVIRSFIEDKQIAIELNLLAQEEFEAKDLEPDSFEYRKYLIRKPQTDKLLQDARDEFSFLEEYERYLAAEAEKTRIEGKTDDEMYEINFYHELATRLVRRAQAQIVSMGRIADDNLLRIMKNQEALSICLNEGLLSPKILNFTQAPSLPSPEVYTIDFLNQLKLEHKDG